MSEVKEAVAEVLPEEPEEQSPLREVLAKPVQRSSPSVRLEGVVIGQFTGYLQCAAFAGHLVVNCAGLNHVAHAVQLVSGRLNNVFEALIGIVDREKAEEITVRLAKKNLFPDVTIGLQYIETDRAASSGAATTRSTSADTTRP